MPLTFSTEELARVQSARIHGIVAKPELNGMFGSLISYNKATGRYGAHMGAHRTGARTTGRMTDESAVLTVFGGFLLHVG